MNGGASGWESSMLGGVLPPPPAPPLIAASERQKWASYKSPFHKRLFTVVTHNCLTLFFSNRPSLKIIMVFI